MENYVGINGNYQHRADGGVEKQPQQLQKKKGERKIKQKEPSSSSSKQDELISELQKNVKQLKRNLQDKKDENKNLRKKLHMECKNINAKHRQLKHVRQELDEVKTQLEKANNKILRDDDEIKKCQATIRELKEHKQLALNRDSQKDAEIQCLAERCGKYSDQLIKLENDLKKQMESCNQAKKDNTRLAEISNKRDKEIETFKILSGHYSAFVENVMSCTNFPKTDQGTVFKTLDMLIAHVRSQMENASKYFALLNKFHKEMESSFSTKLTTNIIQRIPLSTSSLPPLTQQLLQGKVIEVIDLSGSDDNCIKQLFSATPLPSSSKNLQVTPISIQKFIETKASSSKQTMKHAEDVKKRIECQGPNYVGAKFYCVCKFECSSQLQLEHHIKHATQEGKFECEVCFKRFRMFGQRLIHMKSKHLNPEGLGSEKYICGCQTCGQMFETKVLKKQHNCALVAEPKMTLAVEGATIKVSTTILPEADMPTPMEVDDDEQDDVDVEAL